MSHVITVPAEVLRQPTQPVEAIDSRVLQVLKDMEDALLRAKDPQGVGLAAPQIGVSLRIFMIRPDPKKEITTFINPEIIRFSQRQNSPTGKKGVYEGCLSLPHHYAPVKRSTSVTIRYQKLEPRTYNLVPAQETLSGFAAHIVQHEMDHLNGILFIDRVLEQNAKLYKVEGKEWIEINL